jgi:hypothetical protein
MGRAFVNVFLSVIWLENIVEDIGLPLNIRDSVNNLFANCELTPTTTVSLVWNFTTELDPIFFSFSFRGRTRQKT